MKKMVIGILAHVDSGKTTLSESMLYVSGKVRRLGRVDHGDAFLDTYELEKSRGITIFSKQTRALLYWTLRGMWIFPQRWNGHFRYWIMQFW